MSGKTYEEESGEGGGGDGGGGELDPNFWSNVAESRRRRQSPPPKKKKTKQPQSCSSAASSSSAAGRALDVADARNERKIHHRQQLQLQQQSKRRQSTSKLRKRRSSSSAAVAAGRARGSTNGSGAVGGGGTAGDGGANGTASAATITTTTGGAGRKRPRRSVGSGSSSSSAASSSSSSSAQQKLQRQEDETERLTLQLSKLTARRSQCRSEYERLVETKLKLLRTIEESLEELHGLDDDIDSLEQTLRRIATGSATAADGGGAAGASSPSSSTTAAAASAASAAAAAAAKASVAVKRETVEASKDEGRRRPRGGNDEMYNEEEDDEEKKIECDDGDADDENIGINGSGGSKEERGGRGGNGLTMMTCADELLTDPFTMALDEDEDDHIDDVDDDEREGGRSGDATGSGARSANGNGGSASTSSALATPRRTTTKAPASISASRLAVPHHDNDNDDDPEQDLIEDHYNDLMEEELGGPEEEPTPTPAPQPDDAAAAMWGGGGTGHGFNDNGARRVSYDPPPPAPAQVQVHRASTPAGLVPTAPASFDLVNGGGAGSSTRGGGGGGGGGGTLDRYLVRQPASGGGADFAAAASSSASARGQHHQQPRPTREDRNASYLRTLSADAFPWSIEMNRLLRDTFRITSFRDQQKEIINCTLSGDDVFVIMRTGGGKSLTYQLPALLEGRGGQRKVTIVISPLLSLIRDQEEQMNDFVSGSAVSFTSGLQGGVAEHNRRWERVRDPAGGVCLVLVTPEKVHKSNRLKNELEKLHEQKRLGRFVIDEAHCACQWGHDFRPDYTKLGMLKSHFPTIPLIAVTATASDRVREDCCRILRLGTNYQFFRSTANRPNLTYAVRDKADSKGKVVEDMVAFIKEKHPRSAGIVYTFSRKEADEVAAKLYSFGITAASYHSSVSDAAKNRVHRSWMRNETQVVVATIAFGLGINKPDVRFVLHHSLSKSLESYYQESGRAGRDGNPADCVLFYSPKDVPRLLGMIHGESGEGAFWSMVRYGQASGDDSLCRQIILSTLGEPGSGTLDTSRECDGTILKDVGGHAKTATQLVEHENRNRNDVTLQQIVTLWRSKNPPPCVADNPPSKDLNPDECFRVVVALMVENVLQPKITFNAYGATMYVTLGRLGHQMLSSQNPRVVVRLPARKSSATRRKSRAAPVPADDDGWISRNPVATKRKSSGGKAPKKKSSSSSKRKGGTKQAKRSSSGKGQKKKTRGARQKNSSLEVIELDSSSSDDENGNDLASREKRPRKVTNGHLKKQIKKTRDIFDDSSSSDDSEFCFQD